MAAGGQPLRAVGSPGESPASGSSVAARGYAFAMAPANHAAAAAAPLLLRPLAAGDADACDAILTSLPYHFGDTTGRAACARAVRESPGIVASASDLPVAFITWRDWYEASREITWMAVHADWRRRSIGTRLLAELVEGLPHAVRYLVVTTLSASTTEQGSDTYAGTRRFYTRHGFVPIWDPEGWWNAENQAVVMVRSLGGAD
jgi:GNAT superfamily N-acetyltransferase